MIIAGHFRVAAIKIERVFFIFDVITGARQRIEQGTPVKGDPDGAHIILVVTGPNLAINQ